MGARVEEVLRRMAIAFICSRCLGIGLVITLLSVVGPGRVMAQNSHDQHIQPSLLPCLQTSFPRANGLRQLTWELMKRTSMLAELDAVEIDPNSRELFRSPFLLWCCTGPVAPLTESALRNLRRFLSLGGFLWIDDPAAKPGGEFDQSARSVLKVLLPEKKLVKLSRDHVLYKSYFLVERTAGRVLNKPLEGIQFNGGRVAVLFSSNDLLGAVSKDFYGNWMFPCEPGGELQREMSLRMGINIFYYAVCLDYKDDGVHLPFILRRRKR